MYPEKLDRNMQNCPHCSETETETDFWMGYQAICFRYWTELYINNVQISEQCGQFCKLSDRRENRSRKQAQCGRGVKGHFPLLNGFYNWIKNNKLAHRHLSLARLQSLHNTQYMVIINNTFLFRAHYFFSGLKNDWLPYQV